MTLPLGPFPPQGCVALALPCLRTPLPRAGFAVAGRSGGRDRTKEELSVAPAGRSQEEQGAMSEQDTESNG